MVSADSREPFQRRGRKRILEGMESKKEQESANPIRHSTARGSALEKKIQAARREREASRQHRNRRISRRTGRKKAEGVGKRKQDARARALGCGPILAFTSPLMSLLDICTATEL